ncbi:MAG: carbohydrate ABC transporter permease [Thermomicrobiales bacterium]
MLAIAFLLFPILAVVLGSVQTERSLIADPLNPLPDEFTLGNFLLVITGGEYRSPGMETAMLPASIQHFPRAFANSVFVAISVTLLTVAFGSIASYTIARLRFRWARTFMYVNLATRMVPLIVLVVPLYVLLQKLRLLNSLPGLILTEVGFLLPLTIWILVAYFATLPQELEDAARIDGCSRMRAFLGIILPLSAPGLTAAGVIVFIISWHELLLPLVVITRPELTTVPIVLSSLVSDFWVFYTLMMAITLLALLPTVLLVLLLQRYVVSGLTSGAVKG